MAWNKDVSYLTESSSTVEKKGKGWNVDAQVGQ